MKKVSVTFNTVFILIGLMMSTVSIAAAQEAPAVSRTEERLRFKQFTGWLRKTYGAPRRDRRILWEYVNKKVRFQKIDDELSAQAWSIMKRYGIPIGVVLMFVREILGFRSRKVMRELIIEIKDEVEQRIKQADRIIVQVAEIKALMKEAEERKKEKKARK